MRQVIHFASIACVRYVKAASADIIAGNTVRALTEQIGGADLALELPSWSYWRRGNRLIGGYIVCSTHEDLWHIHAEPPGLAAAVRGGNDQAVIVLDVHDSEWGLGREATIAEKEDLDAADLVIVPSETYRDRCPKPAVVVYSGCLDTQEVNPGGGPIDGIVYEGGIDLGGWRDYRALGDALNRRFVRFDILSHAGLNSEIVRAYDDANIKVRHYEYRSMMSQLARYSWSLCAPGEDGHPAYASSFPNKYAESLQAGVPVLASGVPDVARHIARHGCGVSFDRLADLVEYVATHPSPSPEMRHACKAAAESLSMAGQVGVIQSAYAQAEKAAFARRASKGMSFNFNPSLRVVQ